MFKAIQIQTVLGCNRRCVFCPMVNFNGPIKYMDIDIFKKIVDELKYLHFKGRISPYFDEPLLDKRMPDLIRIIRQSCPKSTIMISTNGDLLDEELLIGLFNSGLNSLLINCYDDEEQFIAKEDLIRKVLKRIRDIEEDNKCNIYTTFNYRQKIVQIKEMYDLQADSWTNRSGNVPGAKRLEKPLSLSCPKLFEQFYINYLGQAILCCNDYNFEVIMGDLNKERIIEIWNNELYKKYRKFLKKRNRNIPLCDRCDFDYRMKYVFGDI